MTFETLIADEPEAIELALEEGLSPIGRFEEPLVATRNMFFKRPFPDGFGPFIVWEYNLGSISRFHQTHEVTVDKGLPWRQAKETFQSIEIAFEWIGYTNPSLEKGRVTSLKWNRYQIHMGQLPGDNEIEQLVDAEYLADLSDHPRDVFRRGYHGYDVRSLITSYGMTSETLLQSDSGVQVQSKGSVWSHGQTHNVSATASPSDLVTLGLDYTQGDPVGWGELPWEAPGITWAGISDLKALKSWLLARKPAYIGFYQADMTPIGFRRVGDWRTDLGTGVGDLIDYQFTVRTGFGDGASNDCAFCAVVFDVRNTDETKPGKDWLAPNEIEVIGANTIEALTIGVTPLAIKMKHTVRELVEFTLTI